MSDSINYKEINRKSWNDRVDSHVKSEFYDVDNFLKGKSSLNSIELDLLGDIKGLKILHLQCHFGQDSISLSRMGAEVTGVDLSDTAIVKAQELASKDSVNTHFICSDIYDLPNHLTEKFDIIFTSYGTIGWLPDLEKWANVVSHFLKPNGKFVFVEFHPAVWMFDDNFEKVKYNYFNDGAIIENESGTYAEREAEIQGDYVMWNHSLSEVMNSLFKHNIQIASFNEFDYSPYDCFQKTIEFSPGKFRIKHMDNKLPMVYSLLGIKI